MILDHGIISHKDMTAASMVDCPLKSYVAAQCQLVGWNKRSKHDGYDTGFNDGYSEGYACKLADATEPFKPVSSELPSRIEEAATLIQKRYALMFASNRPAAIGLARSISRIIAETNDGTH